MKKENPKENRNTRCEKTTEFFRKESFEIWHHYMIDPDSGEEYTTSDLDELNTQQVYNQYRERHHIPFPDEIKQIRLQYGLSAAKMSEVLDLGANSYRNYEGGEVPSLANAKLIRLAAKPENFLRFVQEKEAIFSKNAFKKVSDRIADLMKEDKLSKVMEYIWNFHMEANAFTGYVKPQFEKVANFVLYFAEKAKPLKTRLNKLLFYSDFLHFKNYGYSISGCNYRAIPFGPVPSHFHELFGILHGENFIQIEEELFDHGGVGERFMPQKEFDGSLFSEDELASMQQVVDAFEESRTREIIDLSHEEVGWEENQEKRDLINYQDYAFLLKGLS